MKFIKHLILIASLALGTATAETPAQDGKHLFILSGQSNMRNPLPTSFKAAVEKVYGADKVIVVMVAQPSQPIKRWYKKWKLPDGQVEDAPKNGKAPTPNGNIYDALMTRVKKAIEGKAIKSVTYIWMQGEADAGSGWGEVYEESFYGILDQIKADLGVDQVNYVLGRNITFKADSRNNDTAGEDSQPRTVLALVLGPTDRGKLIESRYFRVRITAPKVAIDEIIVNPIAAK